MAKRIGLNMTSRLRVESPEEGHHQRGLRWVSHKFGKRCCQNSDIVDSRIEIPVLSHLGQQGRSIRHPPRRSSARGVKG